MEQTPQDSSSGENTARARSTAGMLHPALAPLLRAVQEARMFDDSKTAVDLVLRAPPGEIAAAAAPLLARCAAAGPAAAQGELRAFIDSWLAPAGGDLEPCVPSDWQQDPPGFLAALAAAAAAAAAAREGAGGGGSDGGDAGDSSGGGVGAEARRPSAAELLEFGRAVHALWPSLSRRAAAAAAAAHGGGSNSGGGAPPTPFYASTLLPLPHAAVVPGDRFREPYYWDSYWVVRGLLASGMKDTARGVVLNLISLLKELGHVPNGARAYYTNRSQPPLLGPMARAVYEATGDRAFLKAALPALARELTYWTGGRKAVRARGRDGDVHALSRYYANWSAPRPESYREDVRTAAEAAAAGRQAGLDSAAAAAVETGAAAIRDSKASSGGENDNGNDSSRRLWRELATIAESGWDFSSRWLADGRSLAAARATQIIPADLNAFIYRLAADAAWAASELGDGDAAARFARAAAARAAAVEQVLWDEAAGCWRDAVIVGSDGGGDGDEGGEGGATGDGSGAPPLVEIELSRAVLASNYVPLWAGVTAAAGGRGAGTDAGSDAAAARAVASLAASGLLQPGGVATTLAETGEQWDWPNAWPPLQHMLAEGAAAYGGRAGAALAARIMRAWVGANLAAWRATGAMHEKLDATRKGRAGGGGEYAPQVGFGWSNGVVLDFSDRYGEWGEDEGDEGEGGE